MKWACVFVLIAAIAACRQMAMPPGELERFEVERPAADGCNTCTHVVKCYAENRTRCLQSGPVACTSMLCARPPREDEYFAFNEVRNSIYLFRFTDA